MDALVSYGIIGPRGATGATGARGATGATGPQGPAGPGLTWQAYSVGPKMTKKTVDVPASKLLWFAVVKSSGGKYQTADGYFCGRDINDTASSYGASYADSTHNIVSSFNLDNPPSGSSAEYWTATFYPSPRRIEIYGTGYGSFTQTLYLLLV